MESFRRYIQKLFAVFKIYFKECFAYPGSSLIWVIADSQGLILPAVWIAATGTAKQVAGMGTQEIIGYYFAAMTVSQFVVCHLIWDMAWDIREGTFSGQLLRPLGYFSFSLARNLAWRCAKLVIFLPLLLLCSVAYGGWPGLPLNLDWAFIFAVILAQLLSFYAGCCITMVCLWTLEFHSLFRLYYLPEYFLSGRLVPLSTLPILAQTISGFLWFRYTVAFPVDILLNRIPAEGIARGFAAQACWTTAFVLVALFLFSRGRRCFSGAGM